jgi:F0F1-type ATP synthase gamma subunit
VDVNESPPSSTGTWQGRMRVKPSGETRDLVTHLLTEHLLVQLYRVIAESVVSEQLARIQAMRLAVENARAVLERLTLEYTVASRQAMTSALLEITTGYQLAQPGRRR